jgi:hypothetical protein
MSFQTPPRAMLRYSRGKFRWKRWSGRRQALRCPGVIQEEWIPRSEALISRQGRLSEIVRRLQPVVMVCSS